VRLAFEPDEAIGIGGEEVRQDLQRDVTIEPCIAGAIYLTHARAAGPDRRAEGQTRMTQPTPRLVVVDPSGRRLLPLDKSIVTMGRRTESDVRVSGVGVSRHHAEIAAEDSAWRLRDLDSKFGVYVNGAKTKEHLLAHGDRIRLGDSGDTEIMFVVGEEEPSRDRSAVSATELRHMAALLEGLRALGSGRVLDDVLALVLDSAIQVTGAKRGFIMLANEEGRLEFKLGRAEDTWSAAGHCPCRPGARS
jgi:pSer/pThr/pTyr-binding forkhead associated (FHA) protein